MSRPFLIAQISDPHLKAGGKFSYGVVDTLGALQRMVAHLNASVPQPDVVVISGDLVDFGRADEYAVLAPVLGQLTMPFYLVPGNHDDREQLRMAFTGQACLPVDTTAPTLDWVEDALPVRLIGLDSTIPGAHGGGLTHRQLAWLDQRLAERPHSPTLLILHHPPFITGIGHMDREPFANAAAFERLVGRHPHVERLLCGHLHRPIQKRFGGTVINVCPGTSHQVVLDLRESAPAHFRLEPAGYLLHRWHPEEGLVTHGGVVGDYRGPFPFYDARGLID
ncbi:phosphodiesterase [Pseudomonas typographi]|uniref:Phosphodiesterase n=1 Tax=Pseudomonas typographi TaxID=2715964 RepID=A0ABR7YXJ8_9PSED|nr:phosphodiesterase [Pseudomonas typographi]MBD1597943.1 phosphodiesterase [Pseudomonas typographi]